ncbi:Photosystem I assembly protein Ycf4 [Planktothrix tepida]|uniref:Photosystem I assembly protein Ycf4 n=2 Tax=Planktothrix TaxID=54304 RepID=A0A1J1LL57_9CYAN|nr:MULTISPECIES: photosystem I assembly protein Ycf4 [Planktothrix]CAD5938928.1 Photosystem I assembly protein Ycf4 [Planktothrix tepida]CAD5972879.1 Photosystem I assembly protein Ycf4 [Planktothrix pseudagardhii]CUR33248.1 Photosystem I assembly protein Ycf4 [Planktothrix tepida PCC 9214]
MSTQTKTTTNQILDQKVTGSRRFSNYWWASVITIGGTGFLLSGISSYLKINLLPFADPTQLIFIPQGIVMGLYGTAALLLALYLWLVILWDLGGGYNEFNRETGKIHIFRWGFPGKNRKVEFNCNVNEVQSIRVDIKDGLNPRRALYLKLKDRREIPLTRVGQPLPLSDLENQGAELAKFLQVPLEGL